MKGLGVFIIFTLFGYACFSFGWVKGVQDSKAQVQAAYEAMDVYRSTHLHRAGICEEP